MAGEKQHSACDLVGLGEASNRHVHQAPGGLLGVLGVQLLQQRRVDGPWAQGVDSHAAAGELDPKLS